MKLKRRSSTFAALSAAFLLFSAAPVQAQGLVSLGSGSYDSPSNPGQTSHFSFFVVDQGNGAARGYAVWVFPQVSLALEVTSFGFVEPIPTSLSIAGPIVAILGTPVNPEVQVGRTGFSSFNDNSPNAADETSGFSLAPLPNDPLIQFLATLPTAPCQALPARIGDLTTVQQLSAVGQCLQSIGQPPQFTPLLTGNVWIR